MHRRPHSSLFIAGAAIAALVFAPSMAAAQLGRLKKAAVDAAKDKTTGKKDDAPSNGEDYVITADRLSAVMAVMEPQMKAVQADMARKASTDDYIARKKAFESCAETAVKSRAPGAMPSTTAMQKYGASVQKIGPMSQRAQAALQAKKYREYIAINDTTTVMSLLSTLIMMDMDGKCKPAYKPDALINDEAEQAARNGSGSSSSSDQLTIAPAGRAGMTNRQFGMVRERVALWALQQSNNAPTGTSKYQNFTPAEQSVLETRGDRLKAMGPTLKVASQHWLAWGDIANW